MSSYSTYSPPPVTAQLPLIHVDDDLLVLDKPSGLLSVPGRGAAHADCLASRVQHQYPEALIVHRLDMSTSGLIVFARSSVMQRCLSVMFQERQVWKRYIACVAGRLPESGAVDLPLIADWPNRPRQKVDLQVGKPSLTRFVRLEYDAERDISRVALEPETGRSHQLRVHMQSLGHPILGDELYADPLHRDRAPRLLLHAQMLRLRHPRLGHPLELSADAPF